MKGKTLKAPAFAAATAIVIAGWSCSTDSGDAHGFDTLVADDKAPDRAECRFGPGDLAEQTLDSRLPTGEEIPIDTFVFIMFENRSFDHYFQNFPVFSGKQVEVAPLNFTNPRADGEKVAIYHEDAYCVDDVNHSWPGTRRQINGGAMDGFIVTNDPCGERALGYYTEEDLPFYYDLADTFGLSDHHHCSLTGGTWPNRMYYFAGTSWGLTDGGYPPMEVDGVPVRSIFHQLNEAGIDWRVYYHNAPSPAMILSVFRDNPDRFRPVDEYFEDARAGRLPPVSYIDLEYDTVVATSNDEHPQGVMQLGQNFARRALTALMESPQWPHAAYIHTYDEHGGFYDHVVPPPACEPDNLLPRTEDGTPLDGRFDILGIRVPLMIASPYSRPGYVSHRDTDSTSVLRLLQVRFRLPALTRRDANAWPLLDFFDFQKPPAFLNPPTPAEAPLNQAKYTACVEAFPGTMAGPQPIECPPPGKLN